MKFSFKIKKILLTILIIFILTVSFVIQGSILQPVTLENISYNKNIDRIDTMQSISLKVTSTPEDDWILIWEDNFDGSGQPDSSNWNYNVGNGYNSGSGYFDGWGNGEWEWYRPENAYQENGNLVIRADYNSFPTTIRGRNWYQFSTRLTTQGKQSWQYGRIEARIAMPSAPGTWPAFWMMGTSCDATYTDNYNVAMSYYDTLATNWSSCGEVDIMEHRNTESLIVQNLFWDIRTGVYPWGDGLNASNPSEDIYVGDVTQFHLYTLEWDSTELRWYVDRDVNPNPTKTMNITGSNQEEFHKPFFLMLNLAIQGQFTGPTDPDINDFPLYMYVDYVRVWQQHGPVIDFITRFYTLCLERTPDPSGLAYWSNGLISGDFTAEDTGYGFVMSAEYIAKATSDIDFITMLYNVFLDRTPDSGELSFWTDQLSRATRPGVLNGFIHSAEFESICTSYGITAYTPGIPGFVNRFYTLALERIPDTEGRDYWVGLLESGAATGEDIANEFIFSDEFIAHNHPDSTFVSILYNAFFDRVPDEEGYIYWMAMLGAGYTREYVLDQFIHSTEFEGICTAYGIEAY